ncbi:pyridoxal phosphate-dependent aminotransferase [Robertkochia solimangrovi]|uniref:pyridoxal phosphate-dependent aminotransferase n=1 Tax=Robertkochia solimangrovi TaxID=2213046 RepID=UPI00117C303F|nr:histidinol-phosphate transaminase [Robertkochia solimangrovi]TRZ45868.1 histidinol phosphate aminotransferase [Robertkochia solimangrovi]
MNPENQSRRAWLRNSAFSLGALSLVPTGIFAREQKYVPHSFNFKWSSGSPLKEYLIDDKKDVVVSRLNANENPYGPSAKALQAFQAEMKTGNRYSWRTLYDLMGMIAEKEGVTTKQIMMGPGSSDLLEKVGMLSFVHSGNIVTGDPCYMSMIHVSKAMGGEWRPVRLTADFQHDLKAMEDAIDSETKLVYITNPNNPTGSATDAKALYDFCDRVSQKVPVFVDEAYIELSKNGIADSMAPLVAKGRNVFVSRTFSKIHGMAGLRIGYMIGSEKSIETISEITRGGMGITGPSIMAAIASMKDTAFLEDCKDKISKAKDYTVDYLKANGFDPIPSETNFVIFPIEMEPKKFLESMTSKGIGVRAFNYWDKDWCRVSIGTMDEMKKFTNAITEVLL